MTTETSSDVSAQFSQWWTRNHHRFPDLAPTQHAGTARQSFWPVCADGWLIGYSTTRVDGGENDGRFVTMAYKPVGRGARSGKAEEWAQVYLRGYATRKAAKARALQLVTQHNG